jgi:ferritin
MISNKLTALINAQIAFEYYSAQLYESFAASCGMQGLEACRSFFLKSAAEERSHAAKFLEYMNDRDGVVSLGDIESPPTIVDIDAQARATVEHERIVSARITEIAKAAFDETDLLTWAFLHSLLLEQVEEEAKAVLFQRRVMMTSSKAEIELLLSE